MSKEQKGNPYLLNPLWILLSGIITWAFWLYYSKNNINPEGIYNLGTWGDSFGVINALTSIVVLYFVYSSYVLQKKELEDTRLVLEGQEMAMKQEKLQTMVISLLELSQNHLNDFRDALIASKFPTPQGRDVISLYLNKSYNIESDSKEGILNGAIKYFRTLKFIEEIIIKENISDSALLNEYIMLLESQITDNLKELHSIIIASKKQPDKEKISFKYLFSNLPIEKPSSENKEKFQFQLISPGV